MTGREIPPNPQALVFFVQSDIEAALDFCCRRCGLSAKREAPGRAAGILFGARVCAVAAQPESLFRPHRLLGKRRLAAVFLVSSRISFAPDGLALSPFTELEFL